MQDCCSTCKLISEKICKVAVLEKHRSKFESLRQLCWIPYDFKSVPLKTGDFKLNFSTIYNLYVNFPTEDGLVKTVNGVDPSIAENETCLRSLRSTTLGTN